MNILDRINKPNDIKDIDREDLPELADEIREFLVSQTVWRNERFPEDQ